MHSSFQYYSNDSQIQNYLSKFAVRIQNWGGNKAPERHFSLKRAYKYFKPYLNLNLLVILFNHMNEFNLLSMQLSTNEVYKY